MSNAIKDKINSGFQIIIFNTRAELSKITQGNNNTVYFIRSDESLYDVPASYIWDGTQYIVLSQVAADLKFFTYKSDIPKAGNVDTLYCNTTNNYIYQWNSTSQFYQFLCEVSSTLIQAVVNLVVKYSYTLRPKEVGITPNTNYTIGFDGRTYLTDGTNKVYLNVYDIIKFFQLVDGKSWSDVIGSIVPIDIPATPNFNDAKYMKIIDYDMNNNDIVDMAENTMSFGGKTSVEWNSRINNMIQIGTTAPTDLTNVKTWYKKI